MRLACKQRRVFESKFALGKSVVTCVTRSHNSVTGENLFSNLEFRKYKNIEKQNNVVTIKLK